MKKVVTIGEILLRLSPQNKRLLNQAETLEISFGGAEANVAASLANFKIPSAFVSVIPNNPLGDMAIKHLQKYGVDTTYVKKKNGRMGVYYLDKGIGLRPYKVIYDRKNSAMSQVDYRDFDFDKIYQDVAWLHISGITPALSKATLQLTKVAIAEAKKRNIKISFDINYRSVLWDKATAYQCLASLMFDVDVFIGGYEDVKNLLLASYQEDTAQLDKVKQMSNEARYQLFFQHYAIKYMATTMRESFSASDNGWQAFLYDGKKYYYSKKYQIRIYDRIGGGDSFASGLIYGLLTNSDNHYIINFATGASALKHAICGDTNIVSVDEVNKLIGGKEFGCLER